MIFCKIMWITLVAMFSGITILLLIFLIKNSRDKKKLKQKENMLKELCNYTFGQIDMVIQDNIKVGPKMKETMKKTSDKYHQFDLVPTPKKDK